MRLIVWGHVAVISGLVMMLAGCASTSGNSNLSAAHSPQLPESYPCQSMHVRAMNCPLG
ncbi:MAG: hypothetical protein QOC89_919 [Paraburkholderia sp.]|jgi:hypothetical protein|nr:hypothetical protein [Paraburkholderia sp.]MEA3128900.1 hypothetical protein [Paraburkholderia sp.]